MQDKGTIKSYVKGIQVFSVQQNGWQDSHEKCKFKKTLYTRGGWEVRGGGWC